VRDVGPCFFLCFLQIRRHAGEVSVNKQRTRMQRARRRRRQATNMRWGSAIANASACACACASANANAHALMHRRWPALCTEQTATRGHSYQPETNTGAATRLAAWLWLRRCYETAWTRGPKTALCTLVLAPTPARARRITRVAVSPSPRSLCKSSRAAALLHCCIASGLAALAAHACARPNLAHKHTPTFISHVSPGPSTASSSRTSRPLSLHRREHATCKPPLTRAPCRRHEFRRAQPPRHV
jgi:hypothetical protein